MQDQESYRPLACNCVVKDESNPKQPSCKKVCSPQGGHCEKDVKSKVAAKKWLDGRLRQNFNNDN